MAEVTMAVPYKDRDHVRRGINSEFGRVVSVSEYGNQMTFTVNPHQGWSEDQCQRILDNLQILITGLMFPRED